MDIYSQMEDASNFSKKDEDRNRKKYENESKVRLQKIITTKLRTSFIGALSSFEQTFGDLWGYGINEADLTDKQRKWRELWDLCRTNVLNNGNHQIRSCENEIMQYIVYWNRHQNILKKKED
ncbi:hypothetical protein EBU24_01875 [bacterium]|nr:hypothetical protein [bacterium]